MRWVQQLVAVSRIFGSLLSSAASGASFRALGTTDILDQAVGVSPDGSTVLTSRHTWTFSGGFADIGAMRTDIYSRDTSNGGHVAGLWCGSNTGSCYEAYLSPTQSP